MLRGLLQGYGQHDAHEALRFILSDIHERLAVEVPMTEVAHQSKPTPVPIADLSRASPSSSTASSSTASSLSVPPRSSSTSPRLGAGAAADEAAEKKGVTALVWCVVRVGVRNSTSHVGSHSLKSSSSLFGTRVSCAMPRGCGVGMLTPWFCYGDCRARWRFLRQQVVAD